MPTLFMVGHSNHPWPVFLSLLERHHINLLIDVRSIPASRRLPQFCKVALTRNLAAAGIEYRHVPELGGKHPLSPEQMLPYAQMTAISARLPERRMALMCAESDYKTCHRHYLLTDIFRGLGFAVKQILSSGELVNDPGPNVLQMELR